MCLEVAIPLLHTIGESLEAFASIRHVNRHQVKVFELHGDRASLLIVLAASKVIADTERLNFCENSCATVASLELRTVPVLQVARWNLSRKLLLNLGLVTFCLVQTENRRVKLLHKSLNCSLLKRCADPCDIPAVDATSSGHWI